MGFEKRVHNLMENAKITADISARVNHKKIVICQPTRSATVPKVYVEIALPMYIRELKIPDTVAAFLTEANFAGIITEKT